MALLPHLEIYYFTLESPAIDLAELFWKTARVVRSLDATAFIFPFAKLEENDAEEGTETLEYLKCALH